MTEDFVHEEWDMAAVGYAMAALEDGEQRTFEEHLEGCQRCQRTVAEASSIGAAMGTAAPVPVPSANLRGRVLGAALAARPSTTTLLPPANGSRPPLAAPRDLAVDVDRRPAPVVPIRSRHARHASSQRNPARVMLSAVAAVLVVAVAAAFVSVVRDRDREKSVADARSRTISSLQHQITQVIPIVLRTYDKKNALVGTAYVEGRTVTIVSSSLKQNDPKVHSYVLWSIHSDKDKNLTFKALTRFTVPQGRPSGVQTIELPADIDFKAFPIFGWSIEPPSTTLPAHPSTVIGVGSP